jgi:serine phosphatase RsbU (regulator of sigma subunit)
LIISRINVFVTLPTMVFGLLTVYTVFYRRLPKISYFFILAGLILSVVGTIYFVSRIEAYVFYGFIGLSALEILRVFILRGIRNGKWLTGVGFLMLMIFVVYQILLGLQLAPMVFGIDLVYPIGVFILAITVSIDLSRAYRRTNKSLERQLVQVKQLSEKTLIQERRAREQEVARKVLEAEVARKTEELEEARNLQLSILPRTIPELPGLEIAASMTTATEVGGDYYDFIVTGEQTLTLAVGDATGHGMKAGTMVATIKGLFSAYGTQMDLIPFFHKCTDVIRDMHLGNLYMAMMLAVFREKEMTVTSAGMPPVLICRAESNEVEEILIKGMPLGGPVEYRYEQKTVELRSGDSILFMSDGFPELFNAEQEMFDYARVRDLFRSATGKAPLEIISLLNRAAAEWRGEQPQNDDMTFVAVRVRD